MYVADYGTASFQVFDQESEAHRFAPEVAVFSMATQGGNTATDSGRIDAGRA